MIGFRVDANEKIATGHLMRCIAIAEACIKKGEKCIFLLAQHKETSKLEDREIPFRILHTKWNDMESEKQVLEQVIKEEHLDYMVVDSYQVTADYLAWLNQLLPVLYIDDMALEKYSVSAVLHYSQWPEKKDYQKQYEGTSTVVLAGMEYTPLREEFTMMEKQERKKSILITTGGTDPFNVSGKLLQECINRKEFDGYEIHVIIGSMNQYEDELLEMKKNNSGIILHKNIKNISDYMRLCELAVSAGGTTLYELCSCGTPTVCFSFADNQKEFAREMGKRTVMLYAGDAREEEIEKNICEKLIAFMDSRQLREKCSANMLKLVDGQGCRRIADIVNKRIKKC